MKYLYCKYLKSFKEIQLELGFCDFNKLTLKYMFCLHYTIRKKKLYKSIKFKSISLTDHQMILCVHVYSLKTQREIEMVLRFSLKLLYT